MVQGSRIVCLSTDMEAAAGLQAIVAAIVPGVQVSAADTSILRGAPAGDCAILSVGQLYASAPPLVHELRARGFDGGIILTADSASSLQALEGRELARYGVEAILSFASLPRDLPAALAQVLAGSARLASSPHGAAVLGALRRTRELMAAGEVATTLQHRLNNPLAALLAEAQLLELEPLGPEHASSVARIVELTRRVIEVARSIEDIAGGGAQ